MLKRISIGWVCLLVAATALQAAVEPLGIALGKHRVHPTRIVARFKSVETQGSLQGASVLANLGLTVRAEFSSVPGLVALDAPRTGLARLAVIPADPAAQAQALGARIVELRRSGLFEYVEPDYVVQALREPGDERYVDGSLWGLRNDGGAGGVVGADISAREAWDITVGSTNVIVAVIDTGIRYTHVELRDQMWVNTAEIPSNGVDDDDNGLVDDVHGINALDPDVPTGDPMDFDDHGTHVAGTIGAAANDGNPHVGVAWNVRLMACKFIGPQGGYTMGAIACIEYASEKGAKILNNSWGGGAYSTALRDAILASQAQNVLFVAAAGNEAEDSDQLPGYPGAYDVDSIVSVAALDRGDQLADFSNYGLTSVDIGAPGVAIYSCISASDTAYEYFDGTSMASPHVAGVAALVRARYPTASVQELKQRLLETAVPVAALDGITVTGGRVNAYKALVAEGDGFLELSVQPPTESVLLPATTQSVFAVVTDTFGVTNATVTGTWLEGLTGQLAFNNEGIVPDATMGDAIYSSEFLVPTNIEQLTLEVVASAPAKSSVTNRVRWYVAAPPLNDFFAFAYKIDNEGGTVVGNSKYATMEPPDEPIHAGVPTVDATLWWVWSPAYDCNALIDTAGTDFDSVLGVYTGNTLGTLREVASADDVGTRQQAYVQFPATQGVTYYIAVGGATGGDRGSVRLRVAPNAQPDTLPPVLVFTSPLAGTTVTTNRITIEGRASDPNSGSGVAQVNVRLASDFTWRVATGTTNWSTTVVLREGENRILANGSDFVRNASDSILLIVNYLPGTVSNDHFANAEKISGAAGVTGVDTRNATREYLEPKHANNEGSRSVWYRWTAEEDGVLTLETVLVTFDTLLGVYTGTSVSELATVAFNDDQTPGSKNSKLTTGVRKGVTYSIAVDGYAASSGSARISWSYAPSVVYQLTVSSTAGGRVKPGSGAFASGSVVQLTATADPGYAFTGWTGDVGNYGQANPVSVTMNADRSVRASFSQVGVTDDFELGRFNNELLNYGFGTNAQSQRWAVQSASAAEGTYSARSGKIGNVARSSLTVSNKMVAGVGSFQVRVSSESNFDTLQFLINGVVKAQWSGDTGWQPYQFAVPDGVNVLEWRYEKDSNTVQGEDAAFIDNLSVPLAPENTGTAAQLMAIANPGGTVIRLQGESGTSYSIETSTDLKHWTSVGTRVATDGWIEIPAAPSGNQAQFYRAVHR